MKYDTEIRICDNCKKKVIGGVEVNYPFKDWYHLVEEPIIVFGPGGSTEWDFCSVKCLQVFIATELE